MVYTGRYTQGDLITEMGLVAVKTSVGYPRYRLKMKIDLDLEWLHPRRYMFNLDESEFNESYIQFLEESQDPEKLKKVFADLLADFPDRKGLALLCFEDLYKTGNESCHRRVFAKWWEEQTGQAIPDLQYLEKRNANIIT